MAEHMSFLQWYVRRGRIDRRTWWLQYALPVAVLSVLALFADVALGNSSIEDLAAGGDYGPVLVTVGFLTLPASISGAATRLHDRGMPAWWLLLSFIPLFGQVALLVLNGFLRGDGGPNRYGPPTSAPQPGTVGGADGPLFPPPSGQQSPPPGPPSPPSGPPSPPPSAPPYWG